MTPIKLRRQDLSYETAQVLNRLARKTDRKAKAFVIQTSGRNRGMLFELYYPEVERGEVLAILRLLLAGYRKEEITPIMVTREREHPRFGARPA